MGQSDAQPDVEQAAETEARDRGDPAPASRAAAGAASEGARADTAPKQAADDGLLDLEHRVLCPDGACVGVVGPDRRCKVCGLPLPDEQPPLSAPGPSAEPAGQADPMDGVSSDEEPDLAGRVLCSDGSCIGVIGPDGRCKVCGTPHLEGPGD
jgi:hypothetical protein